MLSKTGSQKMRGDRLRTVGLALVIVLAAVAGACSKSADNADSAAPTAAAAPDEGGVPGVANRPGSFLAYEHEVSIRLPAAKISSHVAAVRDACMSERFGGCSVLSEEQGAGEAPFGSLKIRAAPQVIQPLVKLGSEGGEISQRSTHAEDLADAVNDNSLRQQRLQVQHQKLSEILERRDLKVEDMMSLSQQMAQLETELQGAEQEAAQQRRRIETNLLTLNFSSENVTVESSKIRLAVRGLGGIWDASIATLITIVGALLPFALFIGLIWGIVRIVIGWKRSRRSSPPPLE
jgi:hypothetical protein